MVRIDNKVALKQLEDASAELLTRTSARKYEGKSLAKDGKFHPRILTLVNQFSDLSVIQGADSLSRILGWGPYNHSSTPSWGCCGIWAS